MDIRSSGHQLLCLPWCGGTVYKGHIPLLMFCLWVVLKYGLCDHWRVSQAKVHKKMLVICCCRYEHHVGIPMILCSSDWSITSSLVYINRWIWSSSSQIRFVGWEFTNLQLHKCATCWHILVTFIMWKRDNGLFFFHFYGQFVFDTGITGNNLIISKITRYAILSHRKSKDAHLVLSTDGLLFICVIPFLIISCKDDDQHLLL